MQESDIDLKAERRAEEKSDIYLAAIDAGTTGERVAIFGLEGRVVAWKHLEHASFYPKPTWIEQDAEDWWRNVCQASKAVLREARRKGITPEMIVGVSVTNQRETIIPVDKDANPLRRAIIWQDRRAIPQCKRIRESIGEDSVYETSGLTVDPYFSAPKIRWIKENQPEVYQKTFKFLLVHDYLAAKLSEVYVTGWDNASRTMLFDIKRLSWSDFLLGSIGIDRDKMPETSAPGEVMGEVTRSAAKSTGLLEGTPVVCGGGDQQCGALGVGVTRPGRIKATTGTGTFMLAYLENPSLDPKKRVLCSSHCIAGSWVQEASIFSTGIIYRWVRDQFSHHQKALAETRGVDPYSLLNEEAAEAPAGSRGVMVIPHFVGAGAPYWDPYTRGVIAGLALGHTRKELIRAILEGIAFEIRKNIEVMRELGISVEEMRVTGGAARNPSFNQIQADVYGIPVLKGEVEESTALGCAILAAVGVGAYKSISEAAENMIHISGRYEPNPQNTELYDKMYTIHKKIYEALDKAGVYKDLADLGI